MKNLILTVFISMQFLNFIMSQVPLCTPDNIYADSAGNVYPRPYHPTKNPNGGILDSACINHYYDFTFTVVVPDSFPFNNNKIKLDSIVVVPNGVLNSPAGLTYSCNPPNCKYLPKSIGCILIYGTPNSSNPIKNYDLKLKTKIVGLGGLLNTVVTLPTFIDSLAHYYMPLFPENSTNCDPNGIAILDNQIKVKISPNPVEDVLKVENTDDFVLLRYELRNLEGKMVSEKSFRKDWNSDHLDINISEINSGIYLLYLFSEKEIIISKIIKH